MDTVGLSAGVKGRGVKLAIYVHLQQRLRISKVLSSFSNKSLQHMVCLLKGQFNLHPFNPEHSQLSIQDAVGQRTSTATVRILFRLGTRDHTMCTEICTLLHTFCFRGTLLLQSAMENCSLYVFINSQGGKINPFSHSFHPLVCHNSDRGVRKFRNFKAL